MGGYFYSEPGVLKFYIISFSIDLNEDFVLVLGWTWLMDFEFPLGQSTNLKLALGWPRLEEIKFPLGQSPYIELMAGLVASLG